MRAIYLSAFVIAFWACFAAAYEVEQEEVLPGTTAREISIISTTDAQAFRPVLSAFQAEHPNFTIRYTVANSHQIFAAIQEGAAFDLAISSAMDLQMKLANDGFARSHTSAETADLPGWARWRDQLYAFAQEPVVIIVSKRGFYGLEMPDTRADLIRILRDNPERFSGKIGTYDPERSGAGYLFATQDARQSDASWRLAEVIGGLKPHLFNTSGDMIAGVQRGDLYVALNVVGSYATARLAADGDGVIIAPKDFTHVLLRTALIPKSSAAPELGAMFLDFLLSAAGQRLIEEDTGLPRINEDALDAGPHLRPIRLDPGLLVFIDPLMRKRFLTEWTAAVVQP